MGRRIKAAPKSAQNEPDAYESGRPSDETAVKEVDQPSHEVYLSFGAVCALLINICGAAGYRKLEHWSWVDCLYAATGVQTTVGIVLAPTTQASRAFTVLLNVLSLGLGVILVNEMRSYRTNSWRRGMGMGGSTDSITLQLMLDLSVAAVTVLAGAAVFAHTEGWPLAVSLYFCMTCATGLGMENISPVKPLSRALFIPFIWGVMGCAINVLATASMVVVGRYEPAWRALWLTGQGKAAQQQHKHAI